MKDFMKTITSAIKCWTTAKIKNSTADWNEKDVNKDSYIKNKPDVALRKEVDAIQNAIDYKMNNSNPVGTGSFSMNRLPNSEIGDYSHAEGYSTEASGNSSHAEGRDTVASGIYSHAEGSDTVATGSESHAEGYYTKATGWNSHAEGYYAEASGNQSHAEGYSTEASGNSSHAEGNETTAIGDAAHAEGYSTKASVDYSHAEGYYTIASGHSSHAEGNSTLATGGVSHAEGSDTKASGGSSHAEGSNTEASGHSSHAEGYSTEASGNSSHAEGDHTKASGDYQHVQGKYNIDDVDADGNPLNNYAHIVGNGVNRVSYNKRSNAHTLDWEGNAWFSGDVYTGSTSGTNRDEGSKKLATEEYVDNNINSTVAIKTFPISETYTSGIFTFARTNIFELIKNQVYHTIPVEGIDGWYLSVPCTDGTFKNICLLSAGSEYRVLYDDTKANVYSFNDNVYYLADYTDKSTSSAVIITKTKNYYYLSTNNTTEYTPTGDYNPATKKYVDNAVANAGGGVQSDWNQNDETASDYVKNRPFYDSRKVESFVYEFDGNVEGKETVTMYNSPYVKVSDIVFPVYTTPQAYVETFSQCKFVDSDELYFEGEIFQILDLVQNQLYEFDNGEFSSAYVVLNDVVYEGVSLSKGVYVAANMWGVYTSKFRVVVETGELKKLDKKYIPDTIARKEYVDNAVANVGSGSGNCFDIIINYDGTNNSAELTVGNYNTIMEKFNNKLPVFAMIYSFESTYRMYYDYPKYIEEAGDFIGIYNSKVDIEFQIFPDDHIEVNDIG